MLSDTDTHGRWQDIEDEVSKLYHTVLFNNERGMPLWHPEPNPPFVGEVHLGDIGVVRCGYFYRVFNVLRPLDDVINAGGVPDGFEPFSDEELGTNYMQVEEDYIPAGTVLVGPGVTYRETTEQKELKTKTYNFKASKKSAALVIWTSCIRASLSDACVKMCQEALEENFKAWNYFVRAKKYKPAKDFGPLLLIRTVVKTEQWATVVFRKPGDCALTVEELEPGIIWATVDTEREDALVYKKSLGNVDPERTPNQTLFYHFIKMSRTKGGLGPLKAQAEPQDFPGEDGIDGTSIAVCDAGFLHGNLIRKDEEYSEQPDRVKHDTRLEYALGCLDHRLGSRMTLIPSEPQRISPMRTVLPRGELHDIQKIGSGACNSLLPLCSVESSRLLPSHMLRSHIVESQLVH